MSEGARTAVPADVPRLVELREAETKAILASRGGDLHRLVEQEATRTETAAADEAAVVEARLSEAIISERACVLVGTYEGAIVGFASGHVEDLVDGSVLGVLDDLFVEPAARGVGVGEALLSEMTEWFASRGCSGVDAQVLPGERSAKARLESSGYKARLIVMHREL